MAGTGELFMLVANYCCIAYATNDSTCLHVQMVLHIVRLAFPFALGFPLLTQSCFPEKLRWKISKGITLSEKEGSVS